MKGKLSLRRKAVCAILILAFVLVSSAAALSYQTYSGSMDAHYAAMAMNVAKTAATMPEPEQAGRYIDGIKRIYLANPAPEPQNEEELAAYFAQYDALKDDGFNRLHTILMELSEASEVLALYMIYVDPQSKTCVYIMVGDDAPGVSPTGTWDIIYEQNYGVLSQPELGFPAYITDTEAYGWLVSAGAPIFADDGSVMAHMMVDISMNSVMKDRRDYLIRLCLILAGVTAILTLLFIRVINSAVVRPINQLAEAAASYVTDRETKEGGESASLFERLSIHTGDELENLADVMRRMELDITGYIRNLTIVTAEKERIGAELDVATQIQAGMLPSIFPPFPERAEFDIYATMQPAREVGGDFYDFFLLDENTLAVVMADVSGKGVPAALFMVIAKTLIKNNAQNGKSPKEVFETVNNLLCENNEAGMFVTAFMGYLDILSGKFTYVNAGHNPPLLSAGGKCGYVETKGGFVLAGMEDTRYRQDEIILKTGDKLLLYTDGVTEANNPEFELFGEERLLATAAAAADEKPRGFIGAVEKAVLDFSSGAEQADDITVLALSYKGDCHE